jgi:hypothetical protein
VRRGRLLLAPLLICLLAGIFAAAGAGSGTRAATSTSITFGITDDAMKYSDDGGALLFGDLRDLGMSENRVIVFWDENAPTKILEQPFLDRMMPVAAAAGIRIVLAIQPIHALAFSTDTAARITAFTNYVKQVALRYPQVREFVIGNEPNVRRFFQPQHAADGSILSAGIYERVLAASYDVLKGVDRRIKVDGLALSPRGNDRGVGVGAESVSPVRFIAALGAAYRTSGRTAPIADVVDVHAYSNINTQPLTRPYQWPQAGAADLDRLKQAWWDAFHGTGQPLFQETGQPAKAGPYVGFRIDESGTQVKIDPSRVEAKLYTGRENVPVVDEATQARYYNDLIALVKCDPDVRTLDLFHLIDEPILLGYQSGLLRVDGSRRPSYATVKKAIAAARTCAKPHLWRHATGVIGARGEFDVSTKPAAERLFWSRVATGEEATAETGIFPASPTALGNRSLRSALVVGGSSSTGMKQVGGLVKANRSRSFELRGKLPPGRYVFAALLRATMNPERTSLLVSAPFTIR